MPSSAGAPAASIASPGCGSASSTTTARYDTSSLVEVLTGTSLVTLDLIDALKARFPGSWTSVAYGSTEIGRGAVLLDSDLYDRPGSVGPAAADGRRRPRRRRRAVAPRPHDVLRLPRPARRHRRRHRRRRLVPHRRPGDARRRRLPEHHRTPLGVDPLRRRVGRAGRGRERRPHPPVGRRRRGGRPPRPELGRGRVRGDRGTARRDAPDRRRAAHARRRHAGRAQAAARRGAGRQSSRARTPPGRYAGAACATPSRRASGPSSPGRASRGRRGRLPARRR